MKNKLHDYDFKDHREFSEWLDAHAKYSQLPSTTAVILGATIWLAIAAILMFLFHLAGLF